MLHEPIRPFDILQEIEKRREQLLHDWTVGMAIREEIIPEAIMWYLDAILPASASEESSGGSSDESSEEDEEEEEAKNLSETQQAATLIKQGGGLGQWVWGS
eukprot:GHVT01102448.1.p1 GENE.GHVT01102448.1~~GHVT01102448.1.p1  ORF type:complete len:102 (+),score=20.98 GHVT01102448.1:506-811(+)